MRAVAHNLSRVMHTLAMMPITLALSGCYVAVNGHQSEGGATAGRTVAAVTRAHASTGSARVSASFGTPAPAASPGGQVSFSRGASAVLILGLVIAEVVNYFSAPSEGHGQFASDAGRSIANTCSCYGYEPGSQLTAASATE